MNMTIREFFPNVLPGVRSGYCFNCHELLPAEIFTADGALPTEYTCEKCLVTSWRMLVWDPQSRQYFNEDNNLVHESAGVILINQDSEILLFYRSKFPSAYTIPAGHVDEGEDVKIAAIREVSEETGISIADAVLIKEDIIIGDSCSRGADIHKWFLYASRIDKVKVELTDEGESYAWFNLDSLPENLTVITKAFLNDADVLVNIKEI
jgi:8-oxo-dGTP pyrophosphatase MutT (NUDIX family)